MRLKVLHITARGDLGGGPRHIEYLLNEIHEKVDCYIACPDEEPFADIFKSIVGKDKYIQVPHRKLEFSALIRLLRFIKKNKITIIHCHGKGASAYGKLVKIIYSKIHLVYTLHGFHIGEYSKFKKSIYIGYEKITTRLVNDIIFVSYSEKEAANHFGLYLNIKTHVVDNGVPERNIIINDLEKDQVRNYFNNPDQKIVLTLSRFDYQKNMDFAYEIVRSMPDVNFLWIGSGPDFAELNKKKLADNLKNLHFTGALNNIDKFLGVCDLYLSTSRWEGMPLALLEAMSAGIPIVASNVTGNKDVISKQTGLLFGAGELKNAITSIRSVLNKTVIIDEVEIRKYFNKRYSSKPMALKTIVVYNQYNS